MNASYSRGDQRRVEVVVALAFAVAGERVQPVVIERVAGDDRRDGVVERQRVGAQPRRRARAASASDVSGPVAIDPGRRQSRALRSRTTSILGWHRITARAPRREKIVAVYGERGAGRYPRQVGALQQQAAQRPQLGLEQAVRVAELGGFEGVAADELGEPIGLVGRGRHHRAHLVQGDIDPALGERPGRFRPGQPSADHGSRSRQRRLLARSTTTSLCPHFMQMRDSPSALLTFFSIPTQPHAGQVSATGLFQVEKSQAG